MSIKEHLIDVPTNIGTVTFIQTVRKNRPKGLRHPYEYTLSIADANSLYAELKALLKPHDKTTCQHAFVERKGLSRGMRLNLFVLSHYVKPLKPKEWAKLCKEIQNIIHKYLGKDARIYAEKHTASDKKSQARYETYIAFTELL